MMPIREFSVIFTIRFLKILDLLCSINNVPPESFGVLPGGSGGALDGTAGGMGKFSPAGAKLIGYSFYNC